MNIYCWSSYFIYCFLSREITTYMNTIFCIKVYFRFIKIGLFTIVSVIMYTKSFSCFMVSIYIIMRIIKKFFYPIWWITSIKRCYSCIRIYCSILIGKLRRFGNLSIGWSNWSRVDTTTNLIFCINCWICTTTFAIVDKCILWINIVFAIITINNNTNKNKEKSNWSTDYSKNNAWSSSRAISFF